MKKICSRKIALIVSYVFLSAISFADSISLPIAPPPNMVSTVAINVHVRRASGLPATSGIPVAMTLSRNGNNIGVSGVTDSRSIATVYFNDIPMGVYQMTTYANSNVVSTYYVNNPPLPPTPVTQVTIDTNPKNISVWANLDY